jgi:hypothetical protein
MHIQEDKKGPSKTGKSQSNDCCKSCVNRGACRNLNQISKNPAVIPSEPLAAQMPFGTLRRERTRTHPSSVRFALTPSQTGDALLIRGEEPAINTETVTR